MYKKIIVGLAVLGSASFLPANAKRVDVSDAKKTALSFLGRHSTGRAAGVKTADELRLSEDSSNSTPYYYVFNKGGDRGFVIVSADDATVPVIGFSDSGRFDYGSMPEAMKRMLADYEAQIRNSAATDGTATSANTLSTVTSRRVLERNTAEWSQETPFNNLIPGRRLVGCVGVAMATIMQYYQYPAAGRGSLDGIDFNHSYDWANMRTDNYRNGYTTEQANAVAQLIADAAQSIQTNFAMSSSSASEVRVPAALVSYFGYDAGVSYKKKSEMSQKAWEQLIMSEIDAGRPVLYSGQDVSAGHAFVCDGYEMRGDQPYFRMNWGWGGIGNDVFLVSSLTPTTQSGNKWNFSEQATVIYNIKPAENSVAWSPVQLTSDGRQIGMSSDRESVGAGDSFTVRAGAFKNVSYDGFSGKIAVALFAADGTFKALVSPEYNYGLAAFQVDGTYYRDFSCTVPAGVTVSPGDVIRMATKANGESEWKAMTGGSLTANAIDATGNDIAYFTVKTPSHIAGATIEDAADRVIKGRGYSFRVIPGNNGDVVTVKANGRIITAGKDFTYTLPNVTEDITLDVYVQNAADVRLRRTLWISGGTLEKALTEEECGTVKSLTLFGTMDDRDFAFIREKMLVDSLDLSGVTITANGTSAANAIPTRAFSRYGSLKYVKLPKNINRLGANAFECTGLSEVEIPASVATWGYNVFLNCSRLTKVRSLRSTPAFVNWCVFVGSPRTQLIVPKGSAALYAAKDNWKDFKSIIEEEILPETAYKVIIQDADGVEVTPLDGNGQEVAPGTKYRFTVGTDGSNGDSRMTVYANNTKLTAVNNVYEAVINANTLIHAEFTEPEANAGTSPWTITGEKGGTGMVTDVINVMPGRTFTIRVNALNIPSGDSFSSGLMFAAALTDKEGRIKEIISPTVVNPSGNTGVMPATFTCCVKESSVNEGNLIRIVTSSNTRTWKLVEGAAPEVKAIIPAIGNEVIYHTVKMPETIEKAIITNAVTQVLHGGDFSFSVNPKLSTDRVYVSVNGKDLVAGEKSANVKMENVKEDLDITISIYDEKEVPYHTYNIYAGQLAEKMTGMPVNKNIRLVGTMNKKDFETIQKYSASITAIDLSDVEITGDGQEAHSLPVKAFAPLSATSVSAIKTVKLPKTLKRIEQSAFYRLYSLTEITIPENVEYIGMYAFTYCPKLKKVTSLAAEPKPLSSDPFPSTNMNKNIVLEIPQGSKAKYQSLSYWNLFNTISEITPTYTVIYDPERAEPYNITTNTDKVNAGGKVSMKVKAHPIYNGNNPVKAGQKYKVYVNGTQHGGGWLAEDYNMWDITVNSDTRFDVVYFYDATLTAPQNVSVNVPQGYSLTDIKEGSDLKFTVTAPDNKDMTVKVRINGAEAMADETGLFTLENIQANAKVDVSVVPVNGATLNNDDLGTIDTGEVAGITDVKLDGEITEETFAVVRENFSGLENIDLSGMANTAIPEKAFEGLSNLVNVNVAECVTEIGDSAFAGCANLETLTLTNVTAIGGDAFAGCEKLTSVIINTTAKTGLRKLSMTKATQGMTKAAQGIGTSSFAGANPNCLVFVMDGMAAGENIIANKGGEEGYVATSDIRINSGYAFDTPNTFTMNGNNVLMEHSLDAGNTWNSLVLPFNMNREEISAAFGGNATVAHLDSISGQTIYFSDDSQKVKANTPFIISAADAKDSYTFSVDSIYSAEDYTADTKPGIEFVAAYAPQTLPEGCYTVSGNTANNAEEETISSFAGYFRIEGGAASYTLQIGKPTGTGSIEAAGAAYGKDKAIYNINGQRMSNLRPGINIINGKKVVVE